MKSIKAAIAAIATMATTIAFGGGLYIVANADFNTPSLVFKVNATTTSEPIPLFSAQLSGVMVKVDDGTVLTNTANQVLTHTFQTTGIHTLKAYSTNARATLDFSDNTSIVEVPPLKDLQIGKYAQLEIMPNFQRCSNLTKVGIPPKVTEFRNWYTLRYCHSLTNVVFNDKLRKIADLAFYYCTQLPSITIPDTVVDIGSQAFAGCSNLTSVVIGAGVTNIGTSAFTGSPKLGEVVVPDNVTVIGKQAFQNMASLSNVVIGAGVRSIEFATLSSNPKLESITLGSNITNIGEKAFTTCSKLKVLEIPASVQTIGSNAF